MNFLSYKILGLLFLLPSNARAATIYLAGNLDRNDSPNGPVIGAPQAWTLTLRNLQDPPFDSYNSTYGWSMGSLGTAELNFFGIQRSFDLPLLFDQDSTGISLNMETHLPYGEYFLDIYITFMWDTETPLPLPHSGAFLPFMASLPSLPVNTTASAEMVLRPLSDFSRMLVYAEGPITTFNVTIPEPHSTGLLLASMFMATRRRRLRALK